MITMLGGQRQACSGPTRRETLKVGALSLLGGCLNSRAVEALEDAGGQTAFAPRAKRVVLFYLQGGPGTQDMWDMKPDAPADVRGEFKPIATSAPGVQICEHLPRTANWMHKAAVVRSVYHHAACHLNVPMYTGYDVNLPGEDFRESDPPSMGSVYAFLEPQPGPLPAYAYLPCPLGWGEARKKAGPYGGFLGRQYDPFSTTCTAFVDHPPDEIWKPQVLRGEPNLGEMALPEGITLDRFEASRRLVEQFDAKLRALDLSGSALGYDQQKRLSLEMVSSPELRAAFDLNAETSDVRDRYGRTLFGSTTLLARRLVERGVRFVNVSWDNFSARFEVSKAAWDTHEQNFPMLRNTLLPNFDQTYSAFVEDLDARGLLDETLVVTMGEMGRTPKVNAAGGRDHWTFCYSVLLAGGGIRGGAIYGASDKQAAFVEDRPVHIRDICATIYASLGIDPQTLIHDRGGRPFQIAHGGQPLRELLS